LALRIGRHIDGFVDAYIGPRDLADHVEVEAPVDARALNEESLALLDELAAADLEQDRKRWLLGQLGALECVTDRLAGAQIRWSDEVERCYGVRPREAPTSDFEKVHSELDAVLPGGGDLRARYNRWIDGNAVPADLLMPAVDALRPRLQEAASAIVDLPPAERVEYQLVRDKSWLAFNWYQGDVRSRVEINVDLPISVLLLAELVAHEAYPGHHTERACKEHLLYRGLGRLETSVFVVQAPEALIAEGIAMNALEEALGANAFAVVADIVGDLGLHFDADAARVVHGAGQGLFSVVTNGAFLVHEQGASLAEAEEYLREWGLESDERAARGVRFFTDPSWRAYISTYSDGRTVCRAFVDRTPDGFRRLLTEQLTVADLVG
ncbi:MAG TPA: DUF885 domain-containing protein, partial [Actinomycetota bacterium]